MNIVNMWVCLFECQCDVVSFKIIMKVPLATQLTYLVGTTRVLMDDLPGWLPSHLARFESSSLCTSMRDGGASSFSRMYSAST